MMVQHRPPEELLLDYAAGNLPEPLSLLVAAHLTVCPESRREVRALENVGAALLEDIEPAEMSDGALDSVLARLDEMPTAETRRPRTHARSRPDPDQSPTAERTILPAPLRAVAGEDLAALPWRQRGGSVSEVDLLPDCPGYRTRLLRIRAGAGVPAHTHDGREFTLVLDGSFSDHTGRYARGDVAVADSEVTHHPVAGKERDCICLAVTDAPLRMTGPLGRILNHFIDM